MERWRVSWIARRYVICRGIVLITPYLQGRAFRPELTATMSAVLERVCSELQVRISDRENDSTIEDIARKIDRLAHRGVTNEADCYRVVMIELAQELREENERLRRLARTLMEKAHALQNEILLGNTNPLKTKAS